MEDIRKKIEDEQLEDVTGGTMIRIVKRDEDNTRPPSAAEAAITDAVLDGGSLFRNGLAEDTEAR